MKNNGVRNTPVKVGRCFLIRAEHDSELLEFLTEFTKKNNVKLATFTAVGALKSGKLGFYDQQTHKYCESVLSGPQEIASLIGNVSSKDGVPFVHAHVVLADDQEKVHAGHLVAGQVFAAEIHLIEMLGDEFVRKLDPVTGLALWDVKT